MTSPCCDLAGIATSSCGGSTGRWPAFVDVQVVEWSHRRSELRIVPDSRHIALWSEHRRHRYFDLAHDAADHFALVLQWARAAA